MKTVVSIRRIGFLLLVFSLATVVLFPPLGAVAQVRSEDIDVVLVIDSSGSMKDNDPEDIRISAAKLFVDLAEHNDRVAVVNMSDAEHTEVVNPLTVLEPWPSESEMLDEEEGGRRGLKTKLESLGSEGAYTYMGTSLKLAYEILDRTKPGRRQYVVMLTDGLPTGESETALEEAIAAFERKRFWKIFPVALGEGADYEYLKNQVAGRTGGVAFKAETPAELIRIYTEIAVMLRYNRYANWVTVQPNMLQTLGTIDPEQRITNMAFVIPKQHDDPFIDVIISPNDTNIVDPGVSGYVYHAEDPRYECFGMYTEGVLLEGEWRARLQSDSPVEMAILVRSDYGIQLTAARPQESWDELSPRYAPLGKELFVQVGVRNAEVPMEEQGDDYYNLTRPQGSLQALLAPLVNMESPFWPPIVLRDDGLAEDLQKEDGIYAGLYQRVESPGNYVLRVQVPSRKDEPIQLSKVRVVEARPLPTASMELLPPQVIAENTTIPVTVRLQQPAGVSVPVNSAEVEVTIKEPQGKVTVLEALGSGDQYSASFVPTQSGLHDLTAQAIIRVAQEGKEIEYIDCALGSYEVVFPGHSLTIAPMATDLGLVASLLNPSVTVQITSDSPETKRLEVSIEGLGEGEETKWVVTPSSIEVPPNQTTSFDLVIDTMSLPQSGPGQFQLTFTSPGGGIDVQNNSVIYSYNIVQALQVWADVTELEVKSVQGMQVSLRIWSDSPVEQTLEIRVEGLKGGSVLPTSIKVPPREETSFTFSVSGASTAPEQGAFRLVLTSPEGTVEVANAEWVYNYTVSSFPFLLVGVPLAVILIAVGGFLAWRAAERRKRARTPWAY
jgi:hypothetical protein